MMLHKIFTLLLIFGAVLILHAERPVGESGKRNSDAEAQTWAGLDLRNCMLNLKSDHEVRWYFFHGDGSVSVTIGEKDGLIASPLWYWRKSGEWMQILRSDGKLQFQMHPSKIGESEIAVDNGRGETEVFEIKRPEEKRK